MHKEIWMEGGMEHIWGREEVHTEFWWGKLMERSHLENDNVDGKI